MNADSQWPASNEPKRFGDGDFACPKTSVYIDYHGRRTCRSVGTSRALAEQVRRQLEAKLALGDDQLVFGSNGEKSVPTFGNFADQWLKDYARVECKTSTAEGYESALRQYLRPKFAHQRLDEIKRDDVKALINSLIAKELSRNTIRNAL